MRRIGAIIILLILLMGFVQAATVTINATNVSDGYVGRTTSGTTNFYSIRNIAGNLAYNSSSSIIVRLRSANSEDADKYNAMERAVISFDTSGIPDDAEITSVKLYIRTYSAGNQLTQLGGVAYGVTGVNLISNGTLDQSDSQNFTSVRYAPDLANGTITASDWNYWTFNDTGIANVSKTGYTNIMIRNAWDIDNSTTGLTWLPTQNITQLMFYPADSVTYRPNLTVEYTNTTGFTMNQSSGTPLLRVAFSADAAPIGTEWSWSLRNDTGVHPTTTVFSTLRDPVHDFGNGNFTIILTTNGIASLPQVINVSSGNGTPRGLPFGSRLFPADYIWNVKADTLPVHSRSSQYVGAQNQTAYMYLSRQLTINVVNESNAYQCLTYIRWPTASDWDEKFQIPDNLVFEGVGGGDQHVFVVNNETNKLYEMGSRAWQNSNGSWSAYTGQVYDLNSYTLRPDGFVTSNAAGVPMAAGIITCNELFGGSINHSLVFAVGMTQKDNVWPAREHGQYVNTSLPPLGTRWRLKSTFNTTGYSTNATIILNALKTYGATLSMLAGDSVDTPYFMIYSENSCPGLSTGTGVGTLYYEMKTVKITDFEVVDTSGLIINADSGQARTDGTINIIAVVYSHLQQFFLLARLL